MKAFISGKHLRCENCGLVQLDPLATKAPVKLMMELDETLYQDSVGEHVYESHEAYYFEAFKCPDCEAWFRDVPEVHNTWECGVCHTQWYITDDEGDPQIAAAQCCTPD